VTSVLIKSKICFVIEEMFTKKTMHPNGTIR